MTYVHVPCQMPGCPEAGDLVHPDGGPGGVCRRHEAEDRGDEHGNSDSPRDPHDPHDPHVPWPFLTRDQYRETVMMGLMLAGCGVVLCVGSMMAAWAVS